MLENSVKRSGNIKFVAVGRAIDRVLVAHLTVNKADPDTQYLTAVKEVLSAPDFSNKVQTGARYRLAGEVNAFNFTTDAEHRIFIVISGQDYPERIVFPMINDLVTKFKKEFATSSLTCAPGGLNEKARKLFAQLVEDYDDPSKKDKLAQVQSSVQDVKLNMHRNMDVLLNNIDKGKAIEASSIRLQDQASLFDQRATQLKRKERCKAYKMWGCVIVSAIIVLGVIVFAFVGVPAAAAAPSISSTAAPSPMATTAATTAAPVTSRPE